MNVRTFVASLLVVVLVALLTGCAAHNHRIDTAPPGPTW